MPRRTTSDSPRIADNMHDTFVYFWFRERHRELYSSTSKCYVEINAKSAERAYELVQRLFDRTATGVYLGCSKDDITWEYVHSNGDYSTLVIRGTRRNRPLEILIRNIKTGYENTDTSYAAKLVTFIDPEVDGAVAREILSSTRSTRFNRRSHTFYVGKSPA